MFTQIGMWLKIRHFLTNGYKTVKFQSNLLKIAKHFVISLYYTHKKIHMNQMNRTIFTAYWITVTIFYWSGFNDNALLIYVKLKIKRLSVYAIKRVIFHRLV